MLIPENLIALTIEGYLIANERIPGF